MVIELGVQCHVITVLSNTMNRMCYWLLCKSKCIGHSNFVAIDTRQNFQNPPPLFHPSGQSPHLFYLQALLHRGDVTAAHQDADHRIELREVSVGGA